MSNQTDHTIVRLRVPPKLKKQIEDSAERNNRSQSAEMVARLEQSFEPGAFRITKFYDLKEPAASIEIGALTIGLYESQYNEIQLTQLGIDNWILKYHAVLCHLRDENAKQLIELGCRYTSL